MNWITLSIPYPSADFLTFYLCLGSVVMLLVSIMSAIKTNGRYRFLKASFKSQFLFITIFFLLWPIVSYCFWRFVLRPKK